MGTLTAQKIIDGARLTLFDPSPGAGWNDVELLAYLNDSIALACSLVGDLHVVVNNAFPLVPGVRQTLPVDGVVLIDVLYTGTFKPVSQQTISEFARVHPDWASITPKADINYFFYDHRSPKTWLNYPPASAGGTVSMVYGAIPAPILITDVIPIPDWTERSLWALVLSKAYAKNSQRQDVAKSTAYLTMGLGLLDKSQPERDKAGARASLLGMPVDVRGPAPPQQAVGAQ